MMCFKSRHQTKMFVNIHFVHRNHSSYHYFYIFKHNLKYNSAKKIGHCARSNFVLRQYKPYNVDSNISLN